MHTVRLWEVSAPVLGRAGAAWGDESTKSNTKRSTGADERVGGHNGTRRTWIQHFDREPVHAVDGTRDQGYRGHRRGQHDFFPGKTPLSSHLRSVGASHDTTSARAAADQHFAIFFPRPTATAMLSHSLGRPVTSSTISGRRRVADAHQRRGLYLEPAREKRPAPQTAARCLPILVPRSRKLRGCATTARPTCPTWTTTTTNCPAT